MRRCFGPRCRWIANQEQEKRLNFRGKERKAGILGQHRPEIRSEEMLVINLPNRIFRCVSAAAVHHRVARSDHFRDAILAIRLAIRTAIVQRNVARLAPGANSMAPEERLNNDYPMGRGLPGLVTAFRVAARAQRFQA
jgi:hypothetical protein